VTGYFDAAPRPLRESDESPARTLVQKTLGHTPYFQRAAELLAGAEGGDPEAQALIVERDGTAAALCLYGPVAGARGVWKIHMILLAERVEPREMGRAMVRAVVDRVRDAGARMIVAELPGDPAFGHTLSLLRAGDFDQDGRVPDFFADGIPLLFLRRDL